MDSTGEGEEKGFLPFISDVGSFVTLVGRGWVSPGTVSRVLVDRKNPFTEPSERGLSGGKTGRRSVPT